MTVVFFGGGRRVTATSFLWSGGSESPEYVARHRKQTASDTHRTICTNTDLASRDMNVRVVTNKEWEWGSHAKPVAVVHQRTLGLGAYTLGLGAYQSYYADDLDKNSSKTPNDEVILRHDFDEGADTTRFLFTMKDTMENAGMLYRSEDVGRVVAAFSSSIATPLRAPKNTSPRNPTTPKTSFKTAMTRRALTSNTKRKAV